MARQKESLWSDKAIKMLRTIPNSWWMKKEAAAIRGLPDILGCVNGFFVAIELKNSNAKKDPSREKLQEYVCSQIGDAGGLAYSRVTELNFSDAFNHIKEQCYLPTGTPDAKDLN
jgi:hypothetical protein